MKPTNFTKSKFTSTPSSRALAKAGHAQVKLDSLLPPRALARGGQAQIRLENVQNLNLKILKLHVDRANAPCETARAPPLRALAEGRTGRREKDRFRLEPETRYHQKSLSKADLPGLG